MRLYLIRHAESANNASPVFKRVEDPPITAVGRLQAQHLANWLATLKLDAFVTSPFRRTLQTAIPVLEAKGCPLQVWHDVFERGGCFRGYRQSDLKGASGMGRSEIIRLLGSYSNRSKLDQSISENGWWHEQAPETDSEAMARAQSVCARLRATFPDGQTIALLIHADFKRMMLEQMLGSRIDLHSFGAIRNAAITKVNWLGNRWQLDYFNSVSHMPHKLVTGKEDAVAWET